MANGRSAIVGLLMLSSIASAAARAEGARYRVRFGSFPPIEVSDSARISPIGSGASDGITPTAPVAPKPPRPESSFDGAATGVTLPAGGSTVAPDAGQTDLPRVTGEDPLPAGEPPEGFTAYMSRIYGVTDPAQVEDIWRIARDEPKDLPDNARWANGLVRWVLQNPGKIPGATTEDLEQPAETRVVRAGGGVSVRGAPWGAITGAIPSGTRLRVFNREGVWLEVEGAGQRGWVSGLWVRVE